MNNKYVLAYLAGLIDGEGYIGIKKSNPYNHLTGRVNPGYHERLQIRMVDEAAIKLLANTLGGWYYKEKPSVAQGRPLYCYQASDRKAAGILKILLPYLIIKRESANTVLLLRDSKNNPDRAKTDKISKSRWGTPMTGQKVMLSPAAVEYRESLYQRCKALNRTGI